MAGSFRRRISPHEPGKQHALDADYFARIDAMDYALANDDDRGAAEATAVSADVVILGVSRTSKAPACVYLANRGIKAGNISDHSPASSPCRMSALSESRC